MPAGDLQWAPHLEALDPCPHAVCLGTEPRPTRRHTRFGQLSLFRHECRLWAKICKRWILAARLTVGKWEVRSIVEGKLHDHEICVLQHGQAMAWQGAKGAGGAHESEETSVETCLRYKPFAAESKEVAGSR